MELLDFIISRDDEAEMLRLQKQAKQAKLEAPRRRCLNNDDTDDFVTLDFETMTAQRTSACSIGMVKVIDAEIVQQFYSIINPVRDENTDREPNIAIHGISLSTAEKAPTFGELFDGIKSFIGGMKIVCHNKATDLGILKSLMDYYGVSGIDTSNSACTYQQTGLSLAACCEKYGLPESNHHNALWDAEACARIYLELIGKPFIDRGGASILGADLKTSREIRKEHRVMLDESQVENKNTVFFNSRVVITGTFECYPDRDDLAHRLQALGAKVNSSISKKTDIVVVGNGAGPKKIEQVQQLKSEGCKIIIMRPHELQSILEGE